MTSLSDLTEALLAAWRTNNQVTIFLVSRLPAAVWSAPVPGAPRKTIRMLAGQPADRAQGNVMPRLRVQSFSISVAGERATHVFLRRRR